MDGYPPEALLAGYPEPMRQIAERLRTIVGAALPEATERVRPGWRIIGYDVPVGRRLVYTAFILPEPEHVHLGFAHGWAMHDPARVLRGEGITRQVRWLTFVPGDPVEAPLCTALLREAADIARMSRGERALRAMDRDASGGA